MVRTYDNWERLVAAVLKREQIWQLCHQDSRTPSLRSLASSDFSSSFRLSSSSFSNLSFDFWYPKNRLPKFAHPLPFKDLARIKFDVSAEKKHDGTGLVLFRGSAFAFGLQELLMAPSYVLGEQIETFDRGFAVSLRDGILVVKKFERGNGSRDKFVERMHKVGSIEHENVVKLRGYYFSENERLILYDYHPQGSVHTMLHGNMGENRADLDWETRLKIAIGAAKGLAHIHSHNIVYANMKSTNIFLNSQGYGCLGDLQLELISVSGYQPPEISRTKKSEFTRKSDVYSFGVFLLELLSGRNPLHAIGRYSNKNFVDWARYNARDEWTALVFDVELLKNPIVKREMGEILEIALSCVEKKPEDRPEMEHVIERIECIFQISSIAYEF